MLADVRLPCVRGETVDRRPIGQWQDDLGRARAAFFELRSGTVLLDRVDVREYRL